LPGKLAKISVRLGEAGTKYPVFAGRISDIQPFSGRDPKVKITIDDGIRDLLDSSVDIPVQFSLTVDECIQKVLDALDWPWGVSLDRSPEIIPFWSVSSDISAWDAIANLAEIGFGKVFVAADGSLTFLSGTRSFTSRTPVEIDDTIVLKEVNIPQPWETIRNDVTISAIPTAKLADSEVLWSSSNQVVVVPAMSSLEIWVDYSVDGSPCRAADLIQLKPYLDFVAYSEQESTGTDLTAYISSTLVDYGSRAQLTLSNSGPTDAFLLRLQLRGSPIVDGSTVSYRAQNSSSIEKYGTKKLILDYQEQRNPFSAQDLLEAVKNFFVAGQLYPKIQIDSRFDYQFLLDIAYPVKYTFGNIPRSTLRSSVGYLEHSWTAETGQAVLTTLSLEPYKSRALSVRSWEFPISLGTATFV